MDRVAVFVDAGYLFAAGSIVLCGEKRSRGDLRLDYQRCIDALTAIAHEATTLPLLRIYWYDGTSSDPTPQHLALAYMEGVKVRLGFVNRHGQQKGVDSLIVTDLITLSRNQAMTDAVILSGDEDIRVGVQQAQETGVRVHLLGIEPARDNQSSFLVQEADSVIEWTQSSVADFLMVAASEPAVSAEAMVIPNELPLGTTAFDGIAQMVVAGLSDREVRAVAALTSPNSIPRQLDGMLLRQGSDQLGRRLEQAERQEIRQAFHRMCEQRVADTA